MTKSRFACAFSGDDRCRMVTVTLSDFVDHSCKMHHRLSSSSSVCESSFAEPAADSRASGGRHTRHCQTVVSRHEEKETNETMAADRSRNFSHRLTKVGSMQRICKTSRLGFCNQSWKQCALSDRLLHDACYGQAPLLPQRPFLWMRASSHVVGHSGILQ